MNYAWDLLDFPRHELVPMVQDGLHKHAMNATDGEKFPWEMVPNGIIRT